MKAAYHKVPSDELEQQTRQPALSERTIKSSALCLLAAFALSVVLNVGLLSGILKPFEAAPAEVKSTYASLSSWIPNTIRYSTEYGPDSGNITDRDRLWASIDDDIGFVAMSDDWAVEKGLRLSQRFPWDQTKGVYVLAAYHNLHCLKLIRRYTSAMAQGKKSIPRIFHHVEHCLDTLLQNEHCRADDLPLSQLSAEQGGKEGHVGDGQNRRCRDWGQLEAFARANHACYRQDPRPEYDLSSTLNTYRFCPEGSPYQAAVDRYFEERDRRKMEQDVAST